MSKKIKYGYRGKMESPMDADYVVTRFCVESAQMLNITYEQGRKVTTIKISVEAAEQNNIINLNNLIKFIQP